jgi:hypothetical protein
MEWISCKDQLPELTQKDSNYFESKTCIVCIRGKYHDVAKWTKAIEGGEEYTGWFDEAIGEPVEEVTHWMPLPSPPKED